VECGRGSTCSVGGPAAGLAEYEVEILDSKAGNLLTDLTNINLP
jgi:hypothetical protein